MTTTKTFLITNRIACTTLGLFEAASEDDAVAAMIRDAGYRDAVHEAEVLESTVEKLRDELVVTEVDVPAAITALAAAMVDNDRNTDVLDDVDAGSSDHWDNCSVYGVAEEIGIPLALIAVIGWPAIRDAYAKAWRAAVELDLAARDEDDAVGWERDPDTRGGEVSSRAIPRAQAREMVAALVAAGWAASDAPDHDDPALSWVYRVRDDAA